MQTHHAVVALFSSTVLLFAQKPSWPDSMDFGPALMTTFSGKGLCGDVDKGLVVRFGDEGAVAFDTELLRMAVAWSGKLKLRGTAYDGSHGPFPSRDGDALAETRPGPGWYRGDDADDPRPIPHGPLPTDWGRYGGHRRVGDQIIIDYRVGDMDVKEHYEIDQQSLPVLRRTLQLGASTKARVMVVLDGPDGCEGSALRSGRMATLQVGDARMVAFLNGDTKAKLKIDGERVVMHVPPHRSTISVCLALVAGEVGKESFDAAAAGLLAEAKKKRAVAALPEGPGAKRWGEPLVTKGSRGDDDGPFAVDTITIPFENPFGSRMRTGAFDFFSDGRAAVSTWNGDVWLVSGIDEGLESVTWQRFATGLFDPLGVRIVEDVLYVHGRDGLTRLIDSNGDGEADRYENFNNQVYITPAFHEFAFDLQTDSDGNFYFSKGAPVNPGGRGFMKIVPHHGTIMKVSKDGQTIEAVATGMRAPNGIGVSSTGVITSGDNEGTYMPRCRLNWIEEAGFYGGVKDTAHMDEVPDQPDLPLCWMPMDVDNSSGGQVWVTGDAWSDLKGRLLHNSYGTCSTYLVLPERVQGQMQGGVVRLPANYSSSAMRGRFSPVDGQLYTIGLKGWQTSAAREGGFHRVRRTSAPLDMPIALGTCDRGIYLTFSGPVDAEYGADPESYSIEVWNYLYSQNYGSPELSVLEPERKRERGKENRDPLNIKAATLSKDGCTVFLEVEGMRPVNQMKITWDLDTADGRALRGELHNTIHALQKDPGFPKK